jgi:glucose dehydrogenase
LISDVRTASPSSDNQDWLAYGGGPWEIRYSNLDRVNQNNVARLQVAWIYTPRMGPALRRLSLLS